MAPNRITPGGVVRRASFLLARRASFPARRASFLARRASFPARRAPRPARHPRRPTRRVPLLLAAALAATLALAACGSSSGGGTTAVPDKGGDAEILNNVLTREMAAIGAYDDALPRLHGRDLTTARRFRAQEQEHIDAILKALRGLGEKAEPEAEEIESAGLQNRTDVLDFLYEVEGISIDDGLRAISHLTASWPRSLLGSIVANQAQHLVLLRRALGAGPLAAIPEAFENGAAPPPAPAAPAGG
jgi:rubrerythrin